MQNTMFAWGKDEGAGGKKNEDKTPPLGYIE